LFLAPWFVKIWILRFGFNEFANGFKDLNFVKLGAAKTASSDQLQAALQDQLLRMIWKLRWLWWSPNQLQNLKFSITPPGIP
jgi:hypothetical protein